MDEFHPGQLDPDLTKGLASLSTAQGQSSDLTRLSLLDLPEARRARTQHIVATDPADVARIDVRDIEIPGRFDGPPVPLRIYRPLDAATTALPCLYTIFGGGFMFGSVEDTHARNAQWCRELKAVVVAVNYRLAPEHPFPAAFDDCYAGFCWTVASADALGIDPARVALHGTSAGAGLAAAMTLLSRDEGGPQACFQFLGVPEVDDRLRTSSARRFVDTPVWNRPNAEVSWDSYLGEGRRGSEAVSKYAAPARETDFSGLPRAYVSVMEFDPLRDEGIAYAQSLMAAGVSVELHALPGTFHSSYRITGATISQRELSELVTVMRRELHAPVGPS